MDNNMKAQQTNREKQDFVSEKSDSKVSETSPISTWICTSVDRLKKSQRFSFRCRFESCLLVLADFNSLERHLCDVHFANLGFENRADQINCAVRGCEMILPDLNAYKRHLLFHCYHARLQMKGMHYIMIQSNGCLSVLENMRQECDRSFCDHPNNIYYNGDVLRCAWSGCKEQFDDLGAYFLHVAMHVPPQFSRLNNDENLTCFWLGCKSMFSDRSQLSKHIQCHTGEKFIACPFCGSFFVNSTKFMDHLYRKNNMPSSRDLKCFLCNKTFATQRLLREHSRRHINTRKCPHCEMTCVGPHNLRLHIADRHSDLRLNVCPQCSRTFSRANDLQRHMQRHVESMTYECDVCNATFCWKNSLTTHKKSHADNSYACHLCKNVYSLGSSLSRHLMRHHQLGLPAGHSRFAYKKCADGFNRLQTERYESSTISSLVKVHAEKAAFQNDQHDENIQQYTV